MAGSRPFVFVSHAGSKKPLVRPIVAALLAARVRVFVDNPQEMGYAGADLGRFERLHGGEDYTHQLTRTVKAASCVLVCLSAEALSPSAEWGLEMNAGVLLDTLVSCRIERFDFAAMGTRWNAHHSLNVMADPATGRIPQARLDALVADVRRKLRRRRVRRLALAGGAGAVALAAGAGVVAAVALQPPPKPPPPDPAAVAARARAQLVQSLAGAWDSQSGGCAAPMTISATTDASGATTVTLTHGADFRSVGQVETAEGGKVVTSELPGGSGTAGQLWAYEPNGAMMTVVSPDGHPTPLVRCPAK